MTKIRINRVISRGGYASVREADEIIKQGRVRVNGGVVKELGAQVDPLTDHITVDGEPLTITKKRHYYLFFKPRGVVSTMEDPEGRRAIADFTEGLSSRVFPAGRLDYDADGLILLTDDGELANRIMHPASKLTKTYQVKITGSLDERSLVRFARGIPLDEGRTLPAKIVPIEVRPANSWYEVTLSEGRNRQIKRMFAVFNRKVLKIRRIAIGPLSLEGMSEGEIRKLTAVEMKALMRAAGMKDEK